MEEKDWGGGLGGGGEEGQCCCTMRIENMNSLHWKSEETLSDPLPISLVGAFVRQTGLMISNTAAAAIEKDTMIMLDIFQTNVASIRL